MKNTRFRGLLAALCLCGLTGNVQAQYLWNSGASGAVTDGANWSGGTSPFEADGTAANQGSVTINSGAPTYSTLNLSGNTALNMSGISALTNGGNVTVSTTKTETDPNAGLTLSNLSWTLANTSTFTLGANGTHSVLTLGENTTLHIPKNEGFVFFGSDLSSGTGELIIESGAHLKTVSAQIGRSKGTTQTVTIKDGGTWTNTSQGRLGEFGTVTINVESGGTFNIAGYAADQAAGKSTINLHGTLSGGFILGTRGTARLNISEGAEWNFTNTHTITFGAHAQTNASIYQTGGTVNGALISFGNTYNFVHGKYGGTGRYFLNGGTLTLSTGMQQFDVVAQEGSGVNVTAHFYLGADSDGNAIQDASEIAGIPTISNVPISAYSGTLYTNSLALRDGTSVFKGSASINIQDSLPESPTAGTPGVFVRNSDLHLTGTAVLNIEDLNTYVGTNSADAPAALTLTDSARINFVNSAADADASKTNRRFAYFNGTNAAEHSSLTLSGSSQMNFTKTYAYFANADASTPAVLTLEDSAQMNFSRWQGSGNQFGYLLLGGKTDYDGTSASVGHAKLVLKDDAVLTSPAVQLAGSPGSTAIAEVSGGTWNANSGQVRWGDRGTFTLNQTGGTINASGFVADSTSGKAYLNISGGTFGGNSIILSTRGLTEINLSGTGKFQFTNSANAAYDSKYAGTAQILKINQTGGELNVKTLTLGGNANPQTKPSYTISAGTGTIETLNGFDLTYLGGTLDIGTMTLSGNELEFVLSEEMPVNPLFSLDALSGTGKLIVSAADGFVFEEGRMYPLFTTVNGGTGLDLSQLDFTSALSPDLAYSISGNVFQVGVQLPEPSTWALFLLGTGFLLQAVRRRSRKA